MTTKQEFAQGLLKLMGLQVNTEDIHPLENAKFDMPMPDNWDQMSPEDQVAWKDKHMMRPNEQQQPTAQNVSANTAQPAQPAPPARAEIPAEITQLTGLVQEVGGVDALRTLLVNAAKLTVSAQATEEQERANLSATIKANSAEFSDEELKTLPLGTLRKVANSLQPVFVDYSGFAPRMMANKADQIAPRPSLLLKN